MGGGTPSFAEGLVFLGELVLEFTTGGDQPREAALRR